MMATASGTYSGRLAFDPDSGFHVDPEGNRVVTPDKGKTWRYAKDDDVSHIERYHEAYVTVDSTANRLAELQLEHGRTAAEGMMVEDHPHHFTPSAEDLEIIGKTVPDHQAPVLTGHTEAWVNNNE